jgi:predicted Zn finger-like uncharacterized protein
MLAYLLLESAGSVYLVHAIAFLSLRHSGHQPSPKLVSGGPVDHPTSIASVSAATQPAQCPACLSSSIVTTAKIPDADSYWRCTKCGDVWNAARSHAGRQAARRWR